jgi:hypothetical protein
VVTGRLKMVLLAAGRVMLGTVTDDADAARNTQPKTL